MSQLIQQSIHLPTNFLFALLTQILISDKYKLYNMALSKKVLAPEHNAWLCRRDEGVYGQSFTRLQCFGSSFKSKLELNSLN